MKQLIIFLTLLIATSSLHGQSYPCDPGTGGVTTVNNVGSIAIGQQATFVFTIVNMGTNNSCVIPMNDLSVYFSMPQHAVTGAPIHYHMVSDSNTGNFFTTTYDAASNTLIATNSLGGMPRLGYDSFFVTVMGDSVTPTIGMNSALNIQAYSSTDNIANNNGNYPMIVTSAVISGMNFDQFEVYTNSCTAEVFWNSMSESNISYYEIEYLRKADMVNFETLVERIAPKGAFRDYKEKIDLSKGEYILRVKAHLMSGEIVYSELRHVSIDCDREEPIRVVSNPILHDKLQLTGTIEGDKIQIFDVSGKILLTTKGTDYSSTVDMPDMPHGVYVISVYRNGDLKFNEKVRK